MANDSEIGNEADGALTGRTGASIIYLPRPTSASAKPYGGSYAPQLVTLEGPHNLLGTGLVASLLILSMLLLGEIQLKNMKTLSMPNVITPDMDYIRVNGDVPFSSLKVGDIICYRPSNAKLAKLAKIDSPLPPRFLKSYKDRSYHMCHRIVAKNQFGDVVVKGDANPYPDPYFVDGSDYLGKVNL